MAPRGQATGQLPAENRAWEVRLDNSQYDAGGNDEANRALARSTHSGGMTLNDWCWHVFQHDLPFGGVGASGMGSYHGREGFVALSHGKAVFSERRGFPIHLFYPPYGGALQRLALRWFLGKSP